MRRTAVSTGMENGVKQGTEGRGKEIYDPASDAWYWLDSIDGGRKAAGKDVYQESLAGEWGDATNDAGERIGKWVRYDADGHMVKGWQTTDQGPTILTQSMERWRKEMRRLMALRITLM